ncbi:MAG: methyltransferase domain-containing protein, partial [Clostridia bacterium]|nr:methyltransferase domain-containing protein [Deltaproteobacteria bacterium]
EGDGPALDVGVGTGRTLIPLLRTGLAIDGLDASADMLAVCRTKLDAEGLKSNLYEQLMQDIEVAKRYATIFIPYSSFLLVPERHDAQRALRRFYDHLVPGGQLLLESFLRTDYDSATDAGQWVLARVGTRPSDGARVYVSRSAWHDHVEQMERVFWRHEVFKDNVLVECRNQEIGLRFYGRDELARMIEEAGFTVREIYGDHLREIVRDGNKVMVVHAQR